VRETEDAFIAATRGKVGDRRWRSARATLGAALLECPGPGRRTLLALDGAAMPSEVLLLVPLEHRPMVAAARPPAEEPAP
jgi:hypothetical protein